MAIAAQDGAAFGVPPAIDHTPAESAAVRTAHTEPLEEAEDLDLSDQGLIVMLQERGVLPLEHRGFEGMLGTLSSEGVTSYLHAGIEGEPTLAIGIACPSPMNDALLALATSAGTVML